VRADRVGQVAGVALFRRQRHDFAAIFEDGTGAGRRQGGAADPVGAAHESFARFAQIRRHRERHLSRGGGRGIEQVEIAGLFVNDFSAAGGGVDHGEVVVIGQLFDCFAIIGKQVELAVAIRPEVERVADPCAVDVVGAGCRLRHFLNGVGRGVVEPDA
jgi:hypothetical protein